MSKIKEPSALVLIQDLGYIYPKEDAKQKALMGMYQCGCGVIFRAYTNNVKLSQTISCGCSKTTHGLSSHRLYGIWTKMRLRTSDESSPFYKNYGARGISVCERWNDVANFIADMYPTYQEGWSIERVDNDKDYCPENCKWIQLKDQAINTRLLRSTNTSGYRGVSYEKSRNRYKSSVCVDSILKHLGRFKTAIEAAQTYDNYVREHNLGLPQNFPTKI